MVYKVHYLDAKGLIGTDTCNGSLSRAQAIAERAIGARMANAVEVRNESGELMFRRPTILDRA